MPASASVLSCCQVEGIIFVNDQLLELLLEELKVTALAHHPPSLSPLPAATTIQPPPPIHHSGIKSRLHMPQPLAVPWKQTTSKKASGGGHQGGFLPAITQDIKPSTHEHQSEYALSSFVVGRLQTWLASQELWDAAWECRMVGHAVLDLAPTRNRVVRCF